MSARILLTAAVLSALLAVVLDGASGFGRVLLAAGMPRAAAPFLTDPAWRGVAEYRAGRWDEAAEAFRAADSQYNLGNAETQAGRYSAALEAYDIARAAGDADASANFDLVAAYYAGLALDPESVVEWFSGRDETGPEMAAPIGEGSGRAAGTGSETTNAGMLLGLPELESREQAGVRRVFDDKFMVANRRWLEQLSDVPGDYLAARISHERKRRFEAGLAPPEPEDPR